MDFKIDFKNCHINSIHNSKLDKKKYRMRAGSVFYKDELLEGGENIDVSTKAFYPPNGHSWIETNDGFIVDWILNKHMGKEILMFDKKRLEKIGIKYIPYKNEEGIIKKIKKYYK